MSLYYNKIQRLNPQDREAPGKWYPNLRSIGTISEKEAALYIADEVTLNEKEAEMAIYLLQKVMVRGLLDGKTFKLGEVGTFYLTTTSEGVDNEGDVSANQIRQINLRFMPAKSLKEKLAKASFKPMESYIYKPKGK